MPGQSGIEGVPLVLEEAPDAKVLVLSMQDDPRYVREAFAAGASGYVLKEAADAEVVAAVREVAARRPVRPPRPRRAAGRGRRRGAGPRGRRPALRPRARGDAAPGPRPHEPGDREDALHLGAHGRDAPCAHHAEAAARRPGPSSSATRSSRVYCRSRPRGRRRCSGRSGQRPGARGVGAPAQLRLHGDDTRDPLDERGDHLRVALSSRPRRSASPRRRPLPPRPRPGRARASGAEPPRGSRAPPRHRIGRTPEQGRRG